MLRVTFYSFKGGVGRTRALLNVAAILARHGQRVVAVDCDLDAPGFGMSRMTKHKASQRGISDFILERRAMSERPLADYVYPILRDECGGRLHLMPTGTRGNELMHRVPSFYADLDSDDAAMFELLVAEVDSELAPDYLLFDGGTGFAEMAGVCTVELPQVLVAMCGLSEHHVRGMAMVLDTLEQHPARTEPVAHVLVMSPVPRPEDLGVRSLDDVADELRTRGGPGRFDDALLASEQALNPLLRGVLRAQQELMPRILAQFDRKAPQSFPRADHSDLYHELPYDPEVPLGDEIDPGSDSLLSQRYRMLARTLTRMHPDASILEVPELRPAPLLLPL